MLVASDEFLERVVVSVSKRRETEMGEARFGAKEEIEDRNRG